MASTTGAKAGSCRSSSSACSGATAFDVSGVGVVSAPLVAWGVGSSWASPQAMVEIISATASKAKMCLIPTPGQYAPHLRIRQYATNDILLRLTVSARLERQPERLQRGGID